MTEKEATPSLTNLPLDILLLIFPYLEPKEFLAVCATCRALNSDPIRFNNVYWSQAARKTFRVRNRPQIPNWYRLYYRLRTQSKVFTWGQNTRGCLGQKQEHARLQPNHPVRPYVRPSTGSSSCDRPKEVQRLHELGVIADLQCGGWSTSVLNDKGTIYTTGVLDGQRTTAAPSRDPAVLVPLEFPPGFPKSGERYEPTTAIRTFSSGRSHVLGLADSGRIWSWWEVDRAPVHVKFHALEYTEAGDVAERELRNVRDVIAGWAQSTAYITGTGIITWSVIQHFGVRQRTAEATVLDTEIVHQWLPIPRTNYIRPKGKQREPDQATKDLGQTVGEVKHWIVLEKFIVFVTDLKKVFGTRTSATSGVVFDSFELSELHAVSSADSTPAAIDVQGAFRLFAVLKSTGEVLVVDQDYLEAAYRMAFESTSSDSQVLPALFKVPALQNTSVIQMAFGDYHYHALHSDGTITSYGIDPKSCGVFGLGPKGSLQTNPSEADEILMGNDVRGSIRHPPGSVAWGADYALVPHSYFSGRRVWFQPEMYDWLAHITRGGAHPQESKDRWELYMDTRDPRWIGELSELIEQYSTAHRQAAEPEKEKNPGFEPYSFQPPFEQQPSIPGDDGLGAHFVLAIAAAGWHSGALVLVNEDLEKAVSDSCRIRGPQSDLPVFAWNRDAFPRIQLSTGEAMPGGISLTPWKTEPPAEFERLQYTGNISDRVFGIAGWVLET